MADIEFSVGITPASIRKAQQDINKVFFGQTSKLVNKVAKQQVGINKALKQGRSEAFQFGRNVEFAAKRLLAWAAPAALIFATVNSLKQAVQQIVKLDTAARRLQFFANRGAIVRDTTVAISQLDRGVNALSATITKLNVTQRAFGNLRNAAERTNAGIKLVLRTARALGLSLDEVSDAIVTVARVGGNLVKTAGDLQNSMQGANSEFVKAVVLLVRLEAGALKANDAVRALVAIQAQFFRSATDSAKAAGNFTDIAAKLAVTSTRTAADIKELSEAVRRVGSAFKNVQNINLDQTLAILEVGFNTTGASVSRLSTGLRRMTTFAVKNAKAIQEISGINIIDPNSGQIRGLEAILEVLQKIKDSAGTALAEELARSLGGRNIEITLALADNIDTVRKALEGVDTVQKRAIKTAESLEAARVQEALVAESLTGTINKLKAAAVGLVESEGTQSALQGILRAVTGAVDGLSKMLTLINDNKVLFAALGVIVGTAIVRGILNFVAGLRDGVRSAAQVAAELRNIVGSQRQIAAGAQAIRASGGPAGGPVGALRGAGLVAGATTATGKSVPGITQGPTQGPKFISQQAGALPGRTTKQIVNIEKKKLGLIRKDFTQVHNTLNSRIDTTRGLSTFLIEEKKQVRLAIIRTKSSSNLNSLLLTDESLRKKIIKLDNQEVVLAAQAGKQRATGIKQINKQTLILREARRVDALPSGFADIPTRRAPGGLGRRRVSRTSIPQEGILTLQERGPLGEEITRPQRVGRAAEKLRTSSFNARGALRGGFGPGTSIGGPISPQRALQLQSQVNASRFGGGPGLLTQGGGAGGFRRTPAADAFRNAGAGIGRFAGGARRLPGRARAGFSQAFGDVFGKASRVKQGPDGELTPAQQRKAAGRGRVTPGIGSFAAGIALQAIAQPLEDVVSKAANRGLGKGLGEAARGAGLGAQIGGPIGAVAGAVAGAILGAMIGRVEDQIDELNKRGKEITAQAQVTRNVNRARALTELTGPEQKELEELRKQFSAGTIEQNFDAAGKVTGAGLGRLTELEDDSELVKKAQQLKKEFDEIANIQRLIFMEDEGTATDRQLEKLEKIREEFEKRGEEVPTGFSADLKLRKRLLDDEISSRVKLKDQAEATAQRNAEAVDKLEQRKNLLSQLAEIQRLISSAQGDITREVGLTIEKEEILKRLKKQGFENSPEQLELLRKQRIAQANILKLQREANAVNKQASLLQQALLANIQGREAVSVNLQFDDAAFARQIKFLEEKKRELESVNPAVGSSEAAELKNITDEQAEVLTQRASAAIAAQVKLVDISKNAALEQISAWRAGAERVVEAFSTIASLQESLANRFAGIGAEAQSRIEAASTFMQTALEESGASIGARLGEVRRLSGARLSAAGASGARQLSTVGPGFSGDLSAQTDRLVAGLVEAGKTANEKLVGERRGQIRFQLAANRQLVADQRAAFDAKIRNDSRALAIQKTTLALEISAIQQRLQSELSFDKLRRENQASFGKLLLESPEQFRDTLADIALSEKFFKGIKNINLGNLTEISSRIQGVRGRGGNELLLRVLKGLEARSQFGGAQAVSGVGNAQLQQVFERLQITLPKDVDASIRKQADAAANSTRLQQEIEQRQSRIAALSESEVQIQQAQLKIATADAQVAIQQREDIKRILEKTREERRRDFFRLLDIQTFISTNQRDRGTRLAREGQRRERSQSTALKGILTDAGISRGGADPNQALIQRITATIEAGVKRGRPEDAPPGFTSFTDPAELFKTVQDLITNERFKGRRGDSGRGVNEGGALVEILQRLERATTEVGRSRELTSILETINAAGSRDGTKSGGRGTIAGLADSLRDENFNVLRDEHKQKIDAIAVGKDLADGQTELTNVVGTGTARFGEFNKAAQEAAKAMGLIGGPRGSGGRRLGGVSGIASGVGDFDTTNRIAGAITADFDGEGGKRRRTFVAGKNQGRNLAREFLSDRGRRQEQANIVRGKLDKFSIKEFSAQGIKKALETAGFGQVAAQVTDEKSSQKALGIINDLTRNLGEEGEAVTRRGLKALTDLFGLAFTTIAEQVRGAFVPQAGGGDTRGARGGAAGQGGGNGAVRGAGVIPDLFPEKSLNKLKNIIDTSFITGGKLLVDNGRLLIKELNVAFGGVSLNLQLTFLDFTRKLESVLSKQINSLSGVRIVVDVPITEHKIEVSIKNAISSEKFASDIAESLAEFFIPREDADRMAAQIAKMSTALIKARLITTDASGN